MSIAPAPASALPLKGASRVRFHAGPTLSVRRQVIECGPKLVADPEHLKILHQGVEVWNAWRAKEPLVAPDLSGADLSGSTLMETNLSFADLSSANLSKASLSEANLGNTWLYQADLRQADLRGSNLNDANLSEANLYDADLMGAELFRANLSSANLSEANLGKTNLIKADLSGANLRKAQLFGANLSNANLSEAKLHGANLMGATLVETNLTDAVLTGCYVYGISSWDVKLSENTKQQDLVITGLGKPKVTVDNIEVAQFVYLILHNEKIRDVVDTVGKKGVLLLVRLAGRTNPICAVMRRAVCRSWST